MSTNLNRPARVGVVTDQSGPLSFMGIANANVAKMVIDDINARGGLLGRPVELFSEDSATDDTVAEAAASKLVDAAKVDVVLGGIYSSTRQAIKGPVVDQAETLYIYPEQYEGQECHPLIFCTGPVPAQQVDPFFPWLMQQTGAKTFYMPSADYIWPLVMNKRVREVVTAQGGSIVGEEYFPLDHIDYERTVEDIMSSGAEVVFNTIVPPGLTPFLEQLHSAGFTARGGHIVCTYFDENFLNLVPAEQVEGLYGCLDYYRDVKDPFSTELINRYDALFPGSAMFTAGSACSGMYRGLKLWEASVNEAGTLEQGDVVRALDHARIAQGPGGPAEMVPGQHHLRMNMFIARSQGGTFKVVKELGHIDPQECEVGL
ncbi:MAG: urea transport system substrate-binding protein [Acidimicrobiia bacterium]|jgi:branched-chain amino acid transport system substrate-binding protein|nr:urea transport system substrate-binding protein [Acidimicrobiia bacterium]